MRVEAGSAIVAEAVGGGCGLGRELAAGDGSVTTGNGARTCGGKGQMTGGVMGTIRARGSGNGSTAGGGGTGSGGTGGGGGHRTWLGKGSNGSRHGSHTSGGRGQITGVVGGTDEAGIGWGMSATTGNGINRVGRIDTVTGGSRERGRGCIAAFNGATGTGSSGRLAGAGGVAHSGMACRQGRHRLARTVTNGTDSYIMHP